MKQITIFFLILSTMQLSGMNRYKHLKSIPNSALARRCLLCKSPWLRLFMGPDQNIKKECDLLEEKLESIATRGSHSSTGDGYWAWAQAWAAAESDKQIKRAVDIILPDESEAVRKEEEIKLHDFGCQLAYDYDKAQAAKSERKLKILEQLKLQELAMDDEEKKHPDIAQKHPVRYPYISEMFEGHVKQICLNNKPGGIWRKNPTEKMCDILEDRSHKVATGGHLEFGFLHSTTFEDKQKEHQNYIQKILPYLSDAVKEEELIKLNEYAYRLEKKYHRQESMKRIEQLEAHAHQSKKDE